MFRPRFEDPIDSAKDAVEKNITLFELQYYYEGLKWNLLNLNITEWTHIAENMVPVKNWDEYDYYTKHYIHGNRTETRGSFQIPNHSFKFNQAKLFKTLIKPVFLL